MKGNETPCSLTSPLSNNCKNIHSSVLSSLNQSLLYSSIREKDFEIKQLREQIEELKRGAKSNATTGKFISSPQTKSGKYRLAILSICSSPLKKH